MGEPGWFAGCFSPGAVPVLVPPGARVVFDGERRLWANHAPRVVTAPGWRIALMGTCAAPTSLLERLLERIARGRENIEALIGLGGSYHVIVDDGHTFTVIGDLAGL